MADEKDKSGKTGPGKPSKDHGGSKPSKNTWDQGRVIKEQKDRSNDVTQQFKPPRQKKSGNAGNSDEGEG